MEDIIRLEEKATELMDAVMQMCKDLDLSAVLDVTLSMEVSVIIAEDDIDKIHKICRSNKAAKFSNIKKIDNGFCRVTVTLE